MNRLLAVLVITLAGCATPLDLTKTAPAVATHDDLLGVATVYKNANYPAQAAVAAAADTLLTACEQAITAAEPVVPAGTTPPCASGPCLMTRAAQLDVSAGVPLAALNAVRVNCKWPALTCPVKP